MRKLQINKIYYELPFPWVDGETALCGTRDWLCLPTILTFREWQQRRSSATSLHLRVYLLDTPHQARAKG